MDIAFDVGVMGKGTWQVLDVTAVVRILPLGLPLALHWRGGLWQVFGFPASWLG